MSGYVTMDNLSTGLSQAASAIASILSLRVPQSGITTESRSGGLCVSENLTAISKAQLGAAVPFAVAGSMVVILAASHVWSHWRASKQVLRKADTASGLLHTALLTDATAFQGVDMSVSIQERHTDASSMPYRSRLIAASVNFGLTVYSAFVTVVIALLHCVTVLGKSGLRLFIQGSVTCDLRGWQAGYLIALVLLVAVPFGIIALTRWSQRHCAQATPVGSLNNDVRLGVARSLRAAYSEDQPSWESVLMLHRLALAMLYTFGTSIPVIQAGLCALVTAVAQLLHVFFQPMRGTATQAYQTVLLMCLLLITVSKFFEASTLQLASPQSDARSTDYCAVVTLLFGYIVPLAGVVVCYRDDVRSILLKLLHPCRQCSKPSCKAGHDSNSEC